MQKVDGIATCIMTIGNLQYVAKLLFSHWLELQALLRKLFVKIAISICTVTNNKVEFLRKSLYSYSKYDYNYILLLAINIIFMAATYIASILSL